MVSMPNIKSIWDCQKISLSNKLYLDIRKFKKQIVLAQFKAFWKTKHRFKIISKCRILTRQWIKARSRYARRKL